MGTRSTLKQIPDVDIPRWAKALGLQGARVEHDAHSSPRGTPAVILSLLKNPANPPNQNRYSVLLSIWGEAHNDGVSMYFVARPYAKGTPVIHMKFKEWRLERAVAAILAVLAYHAERPRLPRKFRLADEWLKKMRNKILKVFYQKSILDVGIDPLVADAAQLCQKRFMSLAGLDVKESVDRVRKEFRLLTEHMSEDEIVTIWRETTVEKVLKS